VQIQDFCCDKSSSPILCNLHLQIGTLFVFLFAKFSRPDAWKICRDRAPHGTTCPNLQVLQDKKSPTGCTNRSEALTISYPGMCGSDTLIWCSRILISFGISFAIIGTDERDKLARVVVSSSEDQDKHAIVVYASGSKLARVSFQFIQKKSRTSK
jgi:hypothetical protein